MDRRVYTGNPTLPLSARRIRALTEPGLYGDGNHLWLRVTKGGSKSWIFRYARDGKAHALGLGSFAYVSLEQARDKADALRRQLRDGIDPLEARAAARTEAEVSKARAITFSECAERFITANQAGWRTSEYAELWHSTLSTYVFPTIGHLPVGTIDTGLVMQILTPIWARRTVTASHVRGRIEAILSFAIALGLRDEPNPARWRGHLQRLLPSPAKVRRVKHHPALDWREAPAFMAELRQDPNVGARALEFLILTATRNNETRGATWDEVDLERAIWTIPAGRMKMEREHRVPLTEPALALLELMEPMWTARGFVFPGIKPGQGLSENTMKEVLRRLGHNELTVHGFRSTFHDWAAETTNFPNHVVEQALAHTIGNAVEAAYRRGDLFTKRVALMTGWGEYLARPAALVIPMRATSSGC